MDNAPLVSAEERAMLRYAHVSVMAFALADTPVCQICETCWPCMEIRLLDALEAAEKKLVQTGIGELTYQASVDRYNAEVTTNAAGGAPVFFEMPHNSKDFHPSVPRLGIFCACEQCKAELEVKP